MFLVVLKICSKFTGEHPCQSAISIKLQNIFNEIALRHGCSLVNLVHTFRTPFTRNTSGNLLLSSRLFFVTEWFNFILPIYLGLECYNYLSCVINNFLWWRNKLTHSLISIDNDFFDVNL